MSITADPDVLDVEFRELPPASRRPPTPAARRKARSRQARRDAAAARRIGLQHLAFFRGYLEGLDLAELADQYLGIGRDVSKAAATCSWLVTAFVAAARKHHDFSTARLLAIRPTALAATSAGGTLAHGAPSLEDFASEHDPDGFYTEKELLELFAARHARTNADAGATLRRQQRNARLRVRQMAALDALARLVVEDPRPEHNVLGWFDTAVALRLADVGLTTLGQLVETINAVGYRWYRRVPRLGEIGARRITAWLAHYGDVAGLRLAAGAQTHPSERTLPGPPLAASGLVTAIVPLERFLLPPELDGSRGAHRNPVKNNSRANNDREAIDFWLADYENPHTRQRYRTEAERLLLWAIFVKRKALSSLDTDDARDYINGFLIDPQPASQWVMTGTAHRGDLGWRPFRGPLSVKSRQDALSALKKFFGELVDAQYLDHNAFAKVRVFTGSTHDAAGNERRVAAKSRLQIERGLTADAWRFAMRVLAGMPDTAAATRMRFVLSFAYSTGLRRAELCGAFTDDVQERYAGPELGTIRLLRVVGKRAKERFVPLVPAVLDLMGDYLESRSLPRDPLACPAATPLIPALLSNAEIRQIRDAARASNTDPAPELAARARQTGPIHPVQLYKAIKQFFAAATAAALREDSPHARAFSAASPHWLRHTFVSHALANGMSLESARNFAGHDSLDTTSIYATAELGRQYREAESFLRRASA
ncbi:phage integrase family protein [Burkholderia stagnalis]|uniref:phage integrase family protein n=1 Tax=Burkholderia stagnalis TaxID=1503054 RepID=UPI000F5BCCF9|nr:phage integrase family protein [Burkholderia stagnalis]RQP98854.1 integrase [Burkholderia stagnalis]RQY64905.1 integrase [Burkholderia stagnalis]